MAVKYPVCLSKRDYEQQTTLSLQGRLSKFHPIKQGCFRKNRSFWFRKWVMSGRVYKTLIRDNKRSQGDIQRLFNTYLASPSHNTFKSKSHVHLLVDGTYFPNGLCLILYYDTNLQ